MNLHCGSKSWGWEKEVKVNKLARKGAELVVSLGLGEIKEVFDLGVTVCLLFLS